MTKKFFSESGCQKFRVGNLAPPWSFSNPSGPLESPKCLLFKYAWLCQAVPQRLGAVGPSWVGGWSKK